MTQPPVQPPVQPLGSGAAPQSCPSCGEPATGESNFCEACGAQLGATPVAASSPGGVKLVDEAAPLEASPISAMTRPQGAPVSSVASGAPVDDRARPCLSCGGVVGADGYCQTCGSKAVSERDHFRESPAAWIAGVSDRGLVHSRNEDAMAMSGTADPLAADRRATLIVLDGVSNTDDSSIGSLAGARACLPLLAAPLPRGMGTPAARVAAVTAAFTAAVAEADRQVQAATTPGTDRPASTTFTAVVLEGSTLWHANIGDSRCYWLPDTGEGLTLTVDDSAAQAQIAAGIPRAQAESSPQAHAITKWLGQDSPSIEPTVAQLDVGGPGWLVACSDGLWNYASEPAQLRAQVEAAGLGPHGGSDPAELALALVAFANAQGGRDNITVTLARVESLDAGQNADLTPASSPADVPTTTEPGVSDG